MDASDMGRLGALCLLRSGAQDSVVTAYPIDDEEITIGRDQSCSLRLYYPAVSSLHAKITFIDRKAFLVVLGTNGVLLDDEPLFPAAATAPGPTTVPLPNHAVLEVHRKRFRFLYPPKHLRPARVDTPTRGGAPLPATPAGPRRALRLSMIASAHVFTPRPSHDPLENLRVLQSPLRTPFARGAAEDIVLVHSDTPRVVEEDRDLVILDEVEEEEEERSSLPLPLPPVVLQHPPATPVRRPRPSLHRAVLVRSAQRVAYQREAQMQEEMEAEEVEDVIAAIAEEGDDEIQELDGPNGQPQPSSWRKSLDMVRDGWDVEEDMEMDEDEEFNEQDEHGDDYADEEIPRNSQHPRLSLGPGAAADSGPRRVRVITPWKVNEIQIPVTVKEEDNESKSSTASSSLHVPKSPTKEKVTDEEREAIRARRRSALATPDHFFKGQTPGSRRTLFPSLAPLPSPNFAAAADSAPGSHAPSAASDESPAPTAPKPSSSTKDEEKEDTAVLLARMKQMVEGVKQRQSLGRQSLSLSPRKRDGGFSLLAPNHAGTHRPSRILIEEEDAEAEADDAEEEQEDSSGPEHPAHGRPAARLRPPCGDGGYTCDDGHPAPHPRQGCRARPIEPKTDEEEEATAAPTRGRRTRQATDSSAASQSEDIVEPPSKPARKTRAKTPTTTTAPARRGTRAKPIEVEAAVHDGSDEDPLDSLPAAKTVKRGTRSKVKQEPEEEGVPSSQSQGEGSAAAARGARAKRGTAAAASKLPRGPTRGRAAATAPAVEAEVPEDKENTPESNDDAEEPPKGAAKAKAGKTTRATKAAGKASADAAAGSGIPMPATRARATRARATKS
ncbi:uncharacterized protein BXZ73DRAFT_102227 [Epithele typhae]|uniref:uncharacterized protein n=1 Tax=Epithele typhae TaxID=378194 RepID=UPI0020086D08|nr:uncharacterized protein BXZ73DRAFT_102227 [Epithele typhae]KAH9929074.1 hypothetical protein BXZ73DRAFT_102227 [Epithele typhae]